MGCLENDILTRFGPGVSTSDGLSDSSSPFLRLKDFFFIKLAFWLTSAVGVEAEADWVCEESSCCEFYAYLVLGPSSRVV